jgi:hypothetical protein
MGNADTNKTQSNSGGDNAANQGGGSAGAPPPAAAPPVDAATVAAAKADNAPRFLVDNKEVKREEYMKAASENGYDLSRMPENYFPSIGTKKHGES